MKLGKYTANIYFNCTIKYSKYVLDDLYMKACCDIVIYQYYVNIL